MKERMKREREEKREENVGDGGRTRMRALRDLKESQKKEVEEMARKEEEGGRKREEEEVRPTERGASAPGAAETARGAASRQCWG